MTLKFGKQKVDLSLFLWVALGWGFFSLGALFFFSGDPRSALLSFALYFLLAVNDLFFMVKTVAAILVLMSDQGEKKRAAYAIQAIVFGSLKMTCLGAIGFCLLEIPRRTSGGVLFGLGTLIVLPFLGGFLWSQQLIGESEEATEKEGRKKVFLNGTDV